MRAACVSACVCVCVCKWGTLKSIPPAGHVRRSSPMARRRRADLAVGSRDVVTSSAGIALPSALRVVADRFRHQLRFRLRFRSPVASARRCDVMEFIPSLWKKYYGNCLETATILTANNRTYSNANEKYANEMLNRDRTRFFYRFSFVCLFFAGVDWFSHHFPHFMANPSFLSYCLVWITLQLVKPGFIVFIGLYRVFLRTDK